MTAIWWRRCNNQQNSSMLRALRERLPNARIFLADIPPSPNGGNVFLFVRPNRKKEKLPQQSPTKHECLVTLREELVTHPVAECYWLLFHGYQMTGNFSSSFWSSRYGLSTRPFSGSLSWKVTKCSNLVSSFPPSPNGDRIFLFVRTV